MSLQGELDGEFGPTDVTRLRHLRTLLTETEPLVERATFDDSLDPRLLRVHLAMGFDGRGRFDVRWSERGYYSIHYTEPDLDCRFDHHPNPHSPAKHFHPPPDAPSHDAEPSCVTVERAELVGLAVIQLWRAAVADDQPGVFNEADDPP